MSLLASLNWSTMRPAELRTHLMEAIAELSQTKRANRDAGDERYTAVLQELRSGMKAALRTLERGRGG